MTMNAQSTQDIHDAISATVEALATPVPKPKAKRPATKKKETKAATPKAQPKEPLETKPVNKLGEYTLADDADIDAVEAATKEAAEAVASIARKDADLLGAYLALGKFQHNATKWLPSSKMRGQYVADKMPASQALDPALRSNCTWLFEALNVEGHEANDLLTTLGINRIEDFKSANPTVIRREYKAHIKAKALEAKAEEAGLTPEEVKARDKQEAQQEAQKGAASTKRKLSTIVKRLKKQALEHPKADETADELGDILETLMAYDKKADMLDYLESL